MDKDKERYRVAIEGGIEGLSFPDLFIRRNGVIREVRVTKDNYIPIAQIEPDVLKRSLEEGCLGRALRKNWVVIEGEVTPEDTEEEVKNMVIAPIEPGVYAPVELGVKKKEEVPAEEQVSKEPASEVAQPTATVEEIEAGKEIPVSSRTYYCSRCQKNHKFSSKVGEKHRAYLEGKGEEGEKSAEQGEEVSKPSKSIEKTKKSIVKISQKVSSDDVSGYEDFQGLKFFLKLKYLNRGKNLDVIKEVYEKTDKSQLKNNAKLRLIREKKL